MRIPPLVRVIVVFAAVIGIAAVVFFWVQSLQEDEEMSPPISVASTTVGGEHEQTGITVRGRGEVRATPDTAVNTVGIETVASTAAEASEELGLVSSNILTALMEYGLDATEIVTERLSLGPVYEGSDKGSVTANISGYQASTIVVATVKEIERASTVLEISVNAGANVVEPVRFSIANDAPLREKALSQAVQDAARKANAMANSLGGNIGSLIWLVEETIYISEERAMARGMMSSQSIPVEAGKTLITATVRANFSYE